MIRLTPNKALFLTVGEDAATQPTAVVVYYNNKTITTDEETQVTTTTYGADENCPQTTVIINTATTKVADEPTGDVVQRDIDTAFITNVDSIAHTYYPATGRWDGGEGGWIYTRLPGFMLLPGESAQYAHAGKFDVYDASGIKKSGSVQNLDAYLTEEEAAALYVLLESIDVDVTLTANSDSLVASQKAVRTFVQQKIADLVNAAPGTLDTLNELADALGSDPNFATTVATSLGTKLSKASNLSDLQNAGTALTNLGLSADGKSLVTAVNYAAMRTLLGLVIGTDVQALLVSGENIKTVNGASIVGAGDVAVEAGAAPAGAAGTVQVSDGEGGFADYGLVVDTGTGAVLFGDGFGGLRNIEFYNATAHGGITAEGVLAGYDLNVQNDATFSGIIYLGDFADTTLIRYGGNIVGAGNGSGGAGSFHANNYFADGSFGVYGSGSYRYIRRHTNYGDGVQIDDGVGNPKDAYLRNLMAEGSINLFGGVLTFGGGSQQPSIRNLSTNGIHFLSPFSTTVYTDANAAQFVVPSATVTTSTPVANFAQTWNAGGVTFTGIKSNITDTASAAASKLIDLQVGGTSMFNVTKDGTANAGTFSAYTVALPHAASGQTLNLSSFYSVLRVGSLELAGDGSAIIGRGLTISGNVNSTTANLVLQAGGAPGGSNVTGGNVTIKAQDGCSTPANNKSGGSVYLDSGQGYGTGTTGDIYVGNTRGNLRVMGMAYLAQRTNATEPSWVNGAAFFNTDLDKLRIGGASAWETVTSA